VDKIPFRPDRYHFRDCSILTIFRWSFSPQLLQAWLGLCTRLRCYEPLIRSRVWPTRSSASMCYDVVRTTPTGLYIFMQYTTCLRNFLLTYLLKASREIMSQQRLCRTTSSHGIMITRHRECSIRMCRPNKSLEVGTHVWSEHQIASIHVHNYVSLQLHLQFLVLICPLISQST
jgi:hypothetical protein